MCVAELECKEIFLFTKAFSSYLCNSEFKLPIGGQDSLLCDGGTCSYVCIIPYTDSHVYNI